MDGKTLLRWFLDLLGEAEFYGDYSSQRKAYECLDWAAALFCREALPLALTATLTTVTAQQDYPLPPDFIQLYAKDRAGRYRVKYTGVDGAVSWPYLTSDERIFFADQTGAEEAPPAAFAIVGATAAAAAVSGTVTSGSAQNGGECQLIDTEKDFTGSDRVYPRDTVHNVTDGSSGYVLEVVDANTLAVALFDGTNDDFTVGDTYRVIPASQHSLRLNRPAGYSGHTITVPYYGMPLPVYAEARTWRFSERTCRAIVAGAVSIFKKPVKDYTGAAAIGGDFAAEIGRLRQERARQILDRHNARRPVGW
jgi:hypothetical protein